MNTQYAVVYSEDARRVILGWDEPDETYESIAQARRHCAKNNAKLHARYSNALSNYQVFARDEDGDWMPYAETDDGY